MFVSILPASQAKACAEKLIEEFNPRVVRTENILSIYAPDGDLVFRAIRMSNDVFVCWFRPKVFESDEVEDK